MEISLKSICCCPGEKPECCILWGQINLFSERGRKGVARFQSFFLLNKMCGWFLCSPALAGQRGLFLQVSSAGLELGYCSPMPAATTTFSENTNYNPLVKIRYMLICLLKISNSMQIENRCLLLQSVLVSLCTYSSHNLFYHLPEPQAP